MFRTIKLLTFPYRSLLLRLIPPILLLYTFLLPAQLSLFPAADPFEATRRLFSLAQVFLSISLLWPLFLYFLPVYGLHSRELLTAMKHPDGLCALVLWLFHQVVALPLYLIYLKLAPSHTRMVLLLAIQSICICVGFAFLMIVFRSAIVAMVFSVAYIAASLLMPQSTLPILIQNNCLWYDLPSYYFPIRAVILGIELICLLLFKSHIIFSKR